ncbi:MAG: glucose-6-phosphate dehydrogenase [Alphaproteobacteria bacterium]
MSVNTGGLSGPCTLVIYGGSGDLAMRMLYPALFYLEQDGLLPPGLRIVAVSRTPREDRAFAEEVMSRFVAQRRGGLPDGDLVRRFVRRLSHCTLDLTGPDAHRRLQTVPGGRILHYLATPPSLYGPICRSIAAAGLNGRGAFLVLEKPIGHDLQSSREINEAVAEAFPEENIFRVDHYLGKETVQNLLVLRFANMLFEPLWNTGGIEQVQITVSETVGVGGRRDYYDEMGALRDMVQNHMMQLLCLVAMEPPGDLDEDAVRNEKVKVVRALRPFSAADAARKTVRGQYTAGVIEGKSVPGYADEAGGGPGPVETFVALRADIDNWRWAGVPFYLRTGKRLPYRYSEIFIQFRPVPHSIFAFQDGPQKIAPNKLIIRLQPEEYIKLLVMNKVPGLGAGVQMKEVALNLSLHDAFGNARRRIAYERLLLDALHADTTLFVRRDEVEAAWEWIDGIGAGWRSEGTAPKPYAAGTWGPASAMALTERDGHSWHEQPV